ncbi:hypothetical protein CLIB1423_19S02014 [[Candida] railenensis]|uniref:Uncharacterized protein n=1 Tax=[Candida] railenensis TaxID=45579 RepID=A0A9P0QUN9_9ASCO|nr:hypothetical protein CLIB1423_19S02014 [[Candida] railenensis]
MCRCTRVLPKNRVHQAQLSTPVHPLYWADQVHAMRYIYIHYVSRIYVLPNSAVSDALVVMIHPYTPPSVVILSHVKSKNLTASPGNPTGWTISRTVSFFFFTTVPRTQRGFKV